MIKQNVKKIKDISYKICLIINLAFLIILCGEVIIRNSFFEIYKYIYGNQTAFIMLLIFLSSILTLNYCIFNNIGMSVMIVGIPYVSLQIINYYKYILKGEYISPFDINLISEAINISSKFNLNLTINMVWSILCLSWIVIITLILKEKIESKKCRHIGTFISSVAILILLNIFINDNIISELGVNVSYISAFENYDNNGFLFTLINKMNKSAVKKPDEYNFENVSNIIDNKGVIDVKDIGIKPNIIIVMNEAFSDATELPNVSFSEDPIPFFRQMQKENTSGNIVTPVFGGSTAQVEYEVLTGNSTYFTDVNNIAYTNYIYEGFPSIVDLLNDIGYDTIAIHPYKKDFYSRDIVYRNLGFSEFITEEDFNNSDRIRSYITDQEVYEMLISKFNDKKEEKPLFFHVVTMQNHGPYSSEFDESYIDVESNCLDNDNRSILSEYVYLLKETDNAFKYLIEYFEKVEEPTIIVFFGDHQPILGDNYSLYRQLGVVENGQNDERFYNIMHTPFIIWNNYDLTNEKYSNIDSSYLGAILLKKAGLNYDKYFNYLYNQINDVIAFKEKFYIDEEGQIKNRTSMTEDTNKVLQNLWILQYDRIFGENYIERQKNDQK